MELNRGVEPAIRVRLGVWSHFFWQKNDLKSSFADEDLARRASLPRTLPLADEVLHPSPIFFETLANAKRRNPTDERQRQRRIERKLN